VTPGGAHAGGASSFSPSPYPASRASSFGDVELVKKIGRGTYGEVWSGVSKGKQVAVKLLSLSPLGPRPLHGLQPPETEHTSEVAAEIRILQRCSCEHIVGYFDTFEREHRGITTLWVVMEYCELGSVLDMMRRADAPLAEEQTAHVCSAVLKALHFMHTELKAIHRDVKAANVLVKVDGQVRLGDLGVAAQMHSTMSKRGTMIGTPNWMAPEALTGVGPSSALYSFKVDIWGLGITAIECAQMAPPYAEIKELFKLIMQVVTGPPPKLRADVATTSSAEFVSFLGQALIKDPTDRPTAAELAQQPFIATSPRTNILEALARQQARSLRAHPESFCELADEELTSQIAASLDINIASTLGSTLAV